MTHARSSPKSCPSLRPHGPLGPAVAGPRARSSPKSCPSLRRASDVGAPHRREPPQLSQELPFIEAPAADRVHERGAIGPQLSQELPFIEA